MPGNIASVTKPQSVREDHIDHWFSCRRGLSRAGGLLSGTAFLPGKGLEGGKAGLVIPGLDGGMGVLGRYPGERCKGEVGLGDGKVVLVLGKPGLEGGLAKPGLEGGLAKPGLEGVFGTERVGLDGIEGDVDAGRETLPVEESAVRRFLRSSPSGASGESSLICQRQPCPAYQLLRARRS